jgi:deoxycytidine triphosphate deaminase
MGLKPDHWIRKMAQEHGMIEPFVEKQVRDGVISYGVSSYGYDMRIADEYKIFTNVHSAIVDPKNFDPKSFVDFKGDVCIIPPNSFVLARSIEYFRIPRSTLCVTIGKSTYARCFRGDTRVRLADGTNPSLEKMARRADDGEMFWGYSINPFGRIIITLLEAPRYIGRDSLVEITLDNGEKINCTPDHEFVTRDGRLVQADSLRSNDALMPFDTSVWRGYTMVYQPLNGTLYPAHRLADEWNLRHEIYQDVPNTHRHHLDHIRQNNMPWNIQRMDASEHIRYHNDEYYNGEDFDPAEHSESVKAAIRELLNDPLWRERFSESQRQKAVNFWNDEQYAEQRQLLIQKQFESWTEERKAALRERMYLYYSQPENLVAKSLKSKEVWEQASDERRNQQREIARNIRLRSEITAEVVEAALQETGSIRGAARLLDCDRATFRRFPDTIAKFRSSPRYRNHKVVSVTPLAGDHDVYCLTVPETGNFALDSGVFVKNCGLIVNVTPLEPLWHGHVTLEISNTTPLPAKVYSNEGVAQVMFFEADEECEISYGDKKGKYQGQTGVTPPRM